MEQNFLKWFLNEELNYETFFRCFFCLVMAGVVTSFLTWYSRRKEEHFSLRGCFLPAIMSILFAAPIFAFGYSYYHFVPKVSILDPVVAISTHRDYLIIYNFEITNFEIEVESPAKIDYYLIDVPKDITYVYIKNNGMCKNVVTGKNNRDCSIRIRDKNYDPDDENPLAIKFINYKP